MARTLAHYRVHQQIGAGGMGTVHRAHDTRLDRDVALKLLPDAVFSDPIARARLVQEARLASALNHPHICTIFEVGEADGQAYIAMELVDGRTLSEHIPAGGLPSEIVLRYGTQIADALAHAHERGVLHRDLKCANVAITADGRAKVLDFGLARRAPAGLGEVPNAETIAVTATGTVVGTPSYLAPELLRGGKADERSDLWSLGVVLYEMATGTLPFPGRTEYERSAKVLNDPPAPMPERLPAGLRNVIRHCLEKDPAHRYSRASEVGAALEALQGDLRAPAASPRAAFAASRTIRRATFALIVVALGLTATVVASRRPWQRRELKQRQMTTYPPGVFFGYGVISPDGRTLALVDDEGLILRDVASGERRPLPLPADFSLRGTIFSLLNWVPDGSALLVSGTTSAGAPCEWTIPVLAGRARKILDNGNLASMSGDGSWLAFVRRGAAGPEFWSSGPNGEEPRRVVASDTSGVLNAWPAWSPRGHRLAYARVSVSGAGVRVRLESCDLGGHVRPIYSDSPARPMHDFTIPVWLPDGRLMFGLADPAPDQGDLNLYALRVDPGSGATSGEPRRITQWQNLALVLPTGFTADGKRLTVGLLRYQSDCYVGQIAGGDSLLQGIKRVTLDDRMDMQPSWLRDNRTLVFTSNRNGSSDLFKQALSAPEAEPLVTGPGAQSGATVSPDGVWLLYFESMGSGAAGARQSKRIMRMPVSGGPAQEVLETQPAASFACAHTPGGPSVLSELREGQTVFTAFDPMRGRGRELMRIPAASVWDLAPDGSALAYVVGPDSTARIRVSSLDGSAGRDVRLPLGLDLENLAWGADSRSWFLVGIDKGNGWHLVRVRADGHATELLPRQMWMYSSAASPDGRLLTYTSNTGEENIWMLEDF